MTLLEDQKKEENQSLISDLGSLTAISESSLLQDLTRVAKALERHESNIHSLQEIKTIVEEISARFSELSYL